MNEKVQLYSQVKLHADYGGVVPELASRDHVRKTVPLIQAALKEAQEVIEREEVIRLSPRDWNWLLDLMESPPKPNAKLKAAMKRYQKSRRDDADTVFNWEP